MSRIKISLITLFFGVAFCAQLLPAAEFSYDWSKSKDRRWVGPDFWANRLQDWQVKKGRLECSQSRVNNPMRTGAFADTPLER